MRVVADHFVDAMCDVALLFVRERAARPAEIETHAVDADPRAGLRHVVAERILQRALQEMRRGVVAPDLAPPPVEDGRGDAFADRNLAALDGTGVCDRFAHVLRVVDFEEAAFARDRTAVADLSAALRVERRAIEQEDAAFAGSKRLHRLIVAQNRNDVALGFEPVIAGELRLDRRQFGERHDLAFGCGVGARARALLAA